MGDAPPVPSGAYGGALAGASEAISDCHLIFEASPVRYSMQVVDSTVNIASNCCSTKAQHDVYLDAIQQFQAKGWGLAGLIDLPDRHTSFGKPQYSTIKLV